MTAIPIVPLQLSLKSMVFLRQILFSIMIRVSPSVAPFKCFMSWHVYVLEMIVPPRMIRHCQAGGWGGGL